MDLKDDNKNDILKDEDEVGGYVNKTKETEMGTFQLLKQLIQMSWPIVCVQICQLALSPISLIFCGHLGDTIGFDGAGLAVSVINCTVIAIGQGMTTACDTLFSQTVLSKNRTLMGDYLQKAIVIYSLTLLPIFALHLNLEPILLLIGQHPETSRIASEYLLIFMPGAWCYFIYLALTKYLLSMDILYPNVFICLFSNAVNAVMHYVFLYEMEMGIRGSAISLSCAHILNLILVLAYIKISGCYKETWAGWSWKCMAEWGPITRLSLSGMGMIAIEWWAFELGLILSGILGTTELGAQSVILQFDLVWFQVPLAIEIACSIRVGQWLGAGHAQRARKVGWIALGLTGTVSLIPLIFFISIPRQLSNIFTTIPDIIDLTSRLLPLVAIYVTLDGIGCACKGILTGTGRQTTSAIIIFISYGVISLPVGIPLMFLTQLRVAGYWIGLAINMLFQAVVLLIIVPQTNWKEQKEKAFNRNKSNKSIEQDSISVSLSESEKLRRKLESSTSPIESTPILGRSISYWESRSNSILQCFVIILLFICFVLGILLKLLL